MNRSHVSVVVAVVVALAIGFGLGSAVGQQSPPADNKGLDAKVESTIDLAPDFPGYQLRLRTITFEPGGVAGFHTTNNGPRSHTCCRAISRSCARVATKRWSALAASSPKPATSSTGRKTVPAARSCWSVSTSSSPEEGGQNQADLSTTLRSGCPATKRRQLSSRISNRRSSRWGPKPAVCGVISTPDMLHRG